MLRKAPPTAWLLSLTACVAATLLVALARAEDPGVHSASGANGSAAPAELPQVVGPSSSLANRLKAIRNSVSSEYPLPSETGAGNIQHVATRPDSGSGSGEAAVVAGPDQLRSVLVKRPTPTRSSGTTIPGRTIPGRTAPSRTGVESGNAAPIGSAAGRGSLPTQRVTPSAPTELRTARRPKTSETTAGAIPYHRMPQQGTRSLSTVGQGPTMRAVLVGPDAMTVGKPAVYRVQLVNQGTASADRLLVYVSIPETVQVVRTEAAVGSVAEKQEEAGRRLVWELDKVPGGSQQELQVVLKATKNRSIDLRVDWMLRPVPITARVEVQQPVLAMDIEGPAEMQIGDTKVFTVTLRNEGNGPAENVMVRVGATGVAARPNPIGTLEAGASRSLEIDFSAQQPGAMKIQADATADGELTVAAAHQVVVRQPKLAVTIVAPPMLFAGSSAAYQIRVANTGDAEATDVILELELPHGAGEGIGIDKKAVTSAQPKWRLGTLAAGAAQVYTVQCQLNESGWNQLVARLRGGKKLSASAAGRTNVEAIADLKLIANDPKGPIPMGQDVVYEIQVLNRGTKEARKIDLVAQFSEGIEPSSARGHQSRIVPGQVIFDTIDAIPAGGQVTLKVTARAATSGNLRFRAELTCENPETKLVTEESTRFYDTEQYGQSPSAAAQGNVPTPARR